MTEVLNPEPLLRALHEAGVQHIIIEGFAVNAHGVIRPSKDLDIVPDLDPANLQRLAGLLADLDARHVGLGDMKAEEFPYGALAAGASEGELDRIPLRVCGLEHLIAMKRAAGRPLDLDDLRRLGFD